MIKEVNYGVRQGLSCQLRVCDYVKKCDWSKLLDSVLIILIYSENKPLMSTNIVFFDFKSCL